MSSRADILLVEDDERLAHLTADYLEDNGFSVAIEARGDNALSTFKRVNPKIVLLDLSLPGRDGIDVCRDLRNQFNGPILLLTARHTPLDQVVGLEAGADDYVSKPVDPIVLVARIRALIRRISEHQQEPVAEDIQIGKLHICSASQSVSLNGADIALTSLEFELLKILACNAGKIVSRDQLHQQARGVEYDGLDRTVDVRISRLRKKLLDTTEPPSYIKTIWGKGYLLAPDAWA